MWESSEEEMEARIEDLSSFLTTIENVCDYDYLRFLVSGISLVPMPKSFEGNSNNHNLLQNSTAQNNNLKAVNFYIKAPVELMILDTIWMLMISKIAAEQGKMIPEAYANRIKSQVLKNDRDLFDGIDFQSNRLFVPYFKQYTSWRDNAFRIIRSRHTSLQDSILISLDLRSYYYSVTFVIAR